MQTRKVRHLLALGIGPVWSLRSADPSSAQREVLPAEEEQGAPDHGERGNEAAALGAVVESAVATNRGAVASLDWDALGEAVARCEACPLCKSRSRTVFGVGEHDARTMIVGEAPGAEEDARGEPFVGQAGKLLDQMLASVGLARTHGGACGAYVANVLKCRPPGNRNPDPAEVARCEPYLHRQVALLRPARVLVMGRFAAQALLGVDASIASLRGRVHRVEIGGLAIPAVVSYHPAYLLRNLADKGKAWADLCLLQTIRVDTQ